MNRSVVLNAHAKLNVFLEVLGKRPDGFHELQTVMLRTNLCDQLTFQESDDGEVRLELTEDLTTPDGARSFPLDHSNLILKAAVALQKSAGTNRGAVIKVVKRIPAQAGLAGGSSNAACALDGLKRLWGLNLSKGQLHEIAATLGSDINFFVEDCSAAVCTGRGEKVRPILCQRLYFVAFRPQAGNSTPQVFSQLQIPDSPRDSALVESALQSGNAGDLQRAAFNRLSSAAQSCNSDMADLMNQVEIMLGRPVLMSGSGSTCFVLARSAREAGRLSKVIRQIDGADFVEAITVV